jgi:hypothetical protein
MATVRTGRNYIERALRIINAIDVGETPDAEEANDAIDLFNDMLGLWSTQSLTIPYIASVEYLTIAGQKVYSIGPGGDWDGIRPINITDAFIRIGDGIDGGSLDIPLVLLSNHQYADIPLKGMPSTQSRALYYENQYPLGRVSLYPVPSAVFSVVLMYNTMFTNVALDTDLSGMPPGYALALQYNLAKYLAVEYNKEWTAAKDKIATDSLGNIKSANIKAPDAEFDSALPGVGTSHAWDWRRG